MVPRRVASYARAGGCRHGSPTVRSPASIFHQVSIHPVLKKPNTLSRPLSALNSFFIKKNPSFFQDRWAPQTVFFNYRDPPKATERPKQFWGSGSQTLLSVKSVSAARLWLFAKRPRRYTALKRLLRRSVTTNNIRVHFSARRDQQLPTVGVGRVRINSINAGTCWVSCKYGCNLNGRFGALCSWCQYAH